MNAAPLPSRAVNQREARRRYGRYVDELLGALVREDPLADAVARDFAAMGRGASRAMLDRALRHGIAAVDDAPESLRALFAAIDTCPDWVDWPAVERAGQTLFRTGFIGGTVLGTKSLMTGYVSPAGNKPLIMSGQLHRRDRIGFRLAETSRFVVDVCTPGGMRRFGAGFATTVRVRIMHAMVRHLLHQSGQWDAEAWGAPINQHDMAGTTLLFSGAFVEGVRQFGFEVDRREAEDYLMLWRLNGWLIGVEPALLPNDEREAMRLAEVIRITQADPDDDARKLVHAMIRSPLQTAPDDAKAQAMAARQVRLGWGFARAMLGEDMADKLELPKTPARHVVPAMAKVISRAEAVANKHASSRAAWRRAWTRAGHRYWKMAIEQGLAGRPASFVPPTNLEGLGLGSSRAAA